MNKCVYIMRGLPGSGKSYVARARAGARGVVVSADDFFTVNGTYQFDPLKLGAAHGTCFFKAVRYLELVVSARIKDATLVVDNTNITGIEIAPYVLLAQAYGWEHKILTIHTERTADLAEMFRRHTHGVPIARFEAMLAALQHELPQTPPWWNQEVVAPGFES